MALPTTAKAAAPAAVEVKKCPAHHLVLPDCRPDPPPPSLNSLNGRSSFSSIREDDTDLAQAFTSSKFSSYTQHLERAVDEAGEHHRPSMGIVVQQADFVPPLTRPNSRLHGHWFPADNFKGWKQINVRGRLASRSFNDLPSLSLIWDPRPASVNRRQPSTARAQSHIQRLPLELLTAVINHLLLDIPPNGITKRNMDLMSLLLTSKKLHGATLITLYRQITIPHSKIFRKFLAHVASHPALGTLVRRFDFCHFNPTTLYETASERSQARNLTADTLLQALMLTPNLQEFLAQEHIDDDLDANVLTKLFFGLDRIQALDFCGSTSSTFRNAFAATMLTDQWPRTLGLKRLSLHKCTTLPTLAIETLLPHLSQLTHLDVTGTRITDTALASIAHTTRITHLNLAKCNQLSDVGITQFLSTHPAVTQSLVWLSLATDARIHETFDVHAVTKLLPRLPKTLKSLSLKGSSMDRSHIALLRPLTKHLEELALGRGLLINDTNGLFTPDVVDEPVDDGDHTMLDLWESHTLRYLDLSDMWHGDLDVPMLYDTSRCALLTGHSSPLDVVEVPEDVTKRLAKGYAPLTRLGWRLSELGSRTWVVRIEGNDSGTRPWKMGAENWGMRKIPVARAEVGGMYGSYMFARKL